MHYQQDWVMRQIGIIISVLRALIAGRNANKNSFDEFAQSSSLDNTLHSKIFSLIREDKIGEAEDLIFDAIEQNEPNIREIAFDFYEKINALPDEKLLKNDFSRDEIIAGLREICKIFQLSEDVFFEILDKIKNDE